MLIPGTSVEADSDQFSLLNGRLHIDHFLVDVAKSNLTIGNDCGPLDEGFACVGLGAKTFENMDGPAARNTAVGYYNQRDLFSRNNYTSACGNTSLGAFCMSALKTGLWNTGLGYYTLEKNRHGHGNFAIGAMALQYLNPPERVITAFADAGGGKTLINIDDVTDLSDGDIIRITGTSNYDGSYTISNLVGSAFEIVKVFTLDDATGYVNAEKEGCFNTAVGGYAGYSLVKGAGNVFLGNEAGYNELGSNKLYIANSPTANPLIYGDFSTKSVKIHGQLGVVSTATPQFYIIHGANTATWTLGASGDLTIIASGGDIYFESNNLTTMGTGRFDDGILDSSDRISVDNENRNLYDSSGVLSFGWESRLLLDSSGDWAIAFEIRQLWASGGMDEILDWSTAGLADFDNTAIKTTGTARFDGGILDSSDRISIDTVNRYLYDVAGNVSFDWEGRILADSLENWSIKTEARQLYASNGTDLILDWSAAGLADFKDTDLTTTGLVTINSAETAIDLSGAGTAAGYHNLLKLSSKTFGVAGSGSYFSGFNRVAGSEFFTLVGPSVSTSIFGGAVDEDTWRRFIIYTNGKMKWGTGSAAHDVILQREGTIGGKGVLEIEGASANTPAHLKLCDAAKLMWGNTWKGHNAYIEYDGTNLIAFYPNSFRLGDDTTNYTNFAANGNLSFVGSAGFYPRRVNQAVIPAAGTGSSQIDTGELLIWRDTDDGKVYLAYNDTDSGIKSVEMI